MSINYFKSKAHSIKNLLSQQNIQIKLSQALELVAKMYGYKNWDTICGVFNHSDGLILSINVNRSSPELVKLLSKGLLPYEIEFRDPSDYLSEDVEREKIDLYYDDPDEYRDYKKQKNYSLQRQKIISEYGGSNELYDFWVISVNERRCFGSNKIGSRCKNDLLWIRYSDKYSDFLKFYFHPFHFCKQHKKLISEDQKKELVINMRKSGISLQRISNEVEVSIHTLKKWLY